MQVDKDTKRVWEKVREQVIDAGMKGVTSLINNLATSGKCFSSEMTVSTLSG